MSSRHTASLTIAAVGGLIAGGVTIWWALGGYTAGWPFAICFIAGGALALQAIRTPRSSLVVVLSLVLFLLGELEPLGGVIASALGSEQPSIGSVVPLLAGAVSLGGVTFALLQLDRVRVTGTHLGRKVIDSRLDEQVKQRPKAADEGQNPPTT
jgi:hypothetical protein